MKTIETIRFGSVNIELDKVIYFSEGILGFQHLCEYIYIDRGEQDGPFAWLQAVEDPDVAFVIIDPRLIKGDYSVRVSEDVVGELEIEQREDADIFVIVSIPGELKDATANLCGPLVINAVKRKGKQVILDNSKYPIRYPIFGNAKEQEVG